MSIPIIVNIASQVYCAGTTNSFCKSIALCILKYLLDVSVFCPNSAPSPLMMLLSALSHSCKPITKYGLYTMVSELSGLIFLPAVSISNLVVSPSARLFTTCRLSSNEVGNMIGIPVCSVEFKGLLSHFEPIPELGAFNIADLFRGISNYYPAFENEIWKLSKDKFFIVKVNDSYYVDSLHKLDTLLPYRDNQIEIICVTELDGKALAIGLGVGLLAVSIFTGIGITTFGLLGVSLIFSSLYKTPKQDNKAEKQDKKSIVFSGTINTTGGGQCLPIAFGENWLGSIVASAYITSESRSVN